MQLQNILNQNSTKTYKIQQLINLGLTRTEITQIIAEHYQTAANYGFVQNVYAKMQSQNTLQNNLPQALSFMPSTFNKRFGVEIESYGIKRENLERALQRAGIAVESQSYNHNTISKWKIISDSSITGENSFELVSPVLQGEAGLAELKKVSEVLTRLGAKINKTCGLHIHFEAIDFNLKQWQNIFINYAKLETTIDEFMPESRRANNAYYCRSIIKYKTAIANATSITNFTSIINDRYHKINPHSFGRHQTIEFRQHSGTVEFEKISNWILFLHNLIDFSKENSVNNANFETIKTFNNTEIIQFYQNRINDLAA